MQEYSKLVETMKSELREHERRAEMAEMRFLQQKQEASARVRESELKSDFTEQKLSKLSEEVVKLHLEGQIK
jgi:hypothetical protein